MLTEQGSVPVELHSTSSKKVLGAGVTGVRIRGRSRPPASLMKPLISPRLLMSVKCDSTASGMLIRKNWPSALRRKPWLTSSVASGLNCPTMSPPSLMSSALVHRALLFSSGTLKAVNVPSALRMKPYRNASSQVSRVNAPTITLPLLIPAGNIFTVFGTAKVEMLPSG